MPAEAINDVGQIYIYIEKTPDTSHNKTIAVPDLNFTPQSMLFTNLYVPGRTTVAHYGVTNFNSTSNHQIYGLTAYYDGTMLYGRYDLDVTHWIWEPQLYIDSKELYLDLTAEETGSDEYQFILIMFEKNITDYDIT